METANEEAAARANEPSPDAPETKVAPTAKSATEEDRDVASLVARARAAQEAWCDLSLRERIAAVHGAKRRLLQRAEEIAKTLHEECGKPIEEAALAEVIPNADLFDYWRDSIEELLDAQTLELDPVAYPAKVGRVSHDPRGVVALITPWNYPIAIPLRTLVPALLAGNAVVWKPSEVTPRCAKLVASIFEGLPKDVLVVADVSRETGAALVACDVDLVVFTGSVATGKKIAAACAERLLPCSLELGGKDAAIVLSDANLERAANGVVWGAFTNAGQNCASIERVYVEKKIADKFLERVVAVTKSLKPGVDTAKMTTDAQLATVRKHLASAIDAGAEVLAGGAPEDASDRAFPPTVVKIQDEATPLMTEETFGPILPVVIVESEAEAIAKANASRYALTTSVWTRSIQRGNDVAKKLGSGVVTINNHGFTAALPAAPWTGAKESGHGVTNGPLALAELTRPRFVLEDRSSSKRELWWYPYTPVLRTIAFAMAKLRGGADLFGRIGAIFTLLVALPKRLFGDGSADAPRGSASATRSGGEK